VAATSTSLAALRLFVSARLAANEAVWLSMPTTTTTKANVHEVDADSVYVRWLLRLLRVWMSSDWSACHESVKATTTTTTTATTTEAAFPHDVFAAAVVASLHDVSTSVLATAANRRLLTQARVTTPLFAALRLALAPSAPRIDGDAVVAAFAARLAAL
jgi:hypothetical protein